MQLESGLSLLEIRYPGRCLDKEEVGQWFTTILQNKLKAYQELFGPQAFPFDRLDLLSRHFVVLYSENGKTTPVSGFQVQDLATCQETKVPFPGVQMLIYNQASEMLNWLKANMGTNPIWFGSYFNSAGALKRQWGRQIRNLISLMICEIIREQTDRAFSFASEASMVLPYFQSIGFGPCPVEQPMLSHPYYDTTLKMIWFEEFKEEVEEAISEIKHFWNQRLILE